MLGDRGWARCDSSAIPSGEDGGNGGGIPAASGGLDSASLSKKEAVAALLFLWINDYFWSVRFDRTRCKIQGQKLLSYNI